MAKKEENNILKIVQGISQVMSNVYDGAKDEEGNPIKVGLRREEGHPVYDSRVMDGFNVQFIPAGIKIKYQCEIRMEEVQDKKFESKIEDLFADIASYIKKQYKKITGNTLTLSPIDKDVKIEVQSASRVRSWVEANKSYKVGGLEIPKGENSLIDKNIKKYLEIGAKAKRPENEYIKAKDNEKKDE